MQTACATCLSQGRSLGPLKSVKLKHISLESLNINVPSESEICWECTAEVMRWSRFRGKAAKAQATLKFIQHTSCHNAMSVVMKQFADRFKSLSTLSTEPQKEDIHFIHLEVDDIKSEITNMIDIELIPINDTEMTEVTEIQKEFIVLKDTNVIDEQAIPLKDVQVSNVIDEQNPLDEIQSEIEDTDTFLHEEEVYITNTLNSVKNDHNNYGQTIHNSDPLIKIFSAVEVPQVIPTSEKIVGQVRKRSGYLESVLNKNKRLIGTGILPQVISENEILVGKKSKRSEVLESEQKSKRQVSESAQKSKRPEVSETKQKNMGFEVLESQQKSKTPEVSESYNNSKRLKSTRTLVSNINLTERHSNVQGFKVTSEPTKNVNFNVSECLKDSDLETKDNILLAQCVGKKTLILQKGKLLLLNKGLILQTGKQVQSKVLATVKSNEFATVQSNKSNTNQHLRTVTATIKSIKVNKYQDTEIESANVKYNKNLDTEIESTVKINKNKCQHSETKSTTVKSNKTRNSETKPSTVSDKSNKNQGSETESVECIKNPPSETESPTVTNIEELITTFTSVKSVKNQGEDSESTFSDSDIVFDGSKPRSKGSNDSQETYTCKYEDCRMIFPRHNRPKRKERETPCPHCGVKVTRLPSHIANVHERDENKYCAQCDVYFPSVGVRNYHMNNHSEHKTQAFKRRIPCPHCDKKWVNQRDVDRHVITIHTKEYPIICDLCGKGFCVESDMAAHVRTKHEGYKKPKDKICPYCSKAFADKKVLEGHKRTHTGERPFHCAHCPWTFVQKTALTTHMKGKHPELCGYVKKLLRSQWILAYNTNTQTF